MEHRTENIDLLIEERRFFELKGLLSELEPTDVEQLLDEIDPRLWIIVFRLLPKDLAADVFTELEPGEQAELLEVFREYRVRDIIRELDPDDRTDLFDELPAGVAKRLMQYLSPEERREARELLGYPEESVGREMTTEFVELREGMTVGEALAHIRINAPDSETIYTSYVLGTGRKLAGVVSLREMLLTDDVVPISEVMNRSPVTVFTTDDREEAARKLTRYDFLALPAVDAEGRMVGIITFDDVVDVLDEEATEDIEHMAAVSYEDRSYLDSSIWQLVRRRIFWLALLLVLEGFTTNVMGHFEEMIAGMVILTFFIPTLVGVGGNTGAQISAMVIRGMSLGELTGRDLRRVILREILVGGILALALGILLMLRAALLTPRWDIAMAVALALAVVVWFSNMIGAILPAAADRIGIDPAVMAGPVVTTLVDVVGIGMYFGIISLVLL